MNTEILGKITHLQPRLLMLTLLFCLLSIGISNGQIKDRKIPGEPEIRKRISAIMRHTLKQGEFTVNGVIAAWTRTPPSKESVEEIQRYGDDAVPILSEYLISEDDREKELAMRFLGLLGGSRIVEPLRTVIENDNSPSIREIALRWLTQAPWDLASPIIQEAAEKDPDPGVKKVARELLIEYAPK